MAGSVLVFATSAAVLVLEILAGRLLAPYVGVTLETYTGIIGVVLAGISAGSWFGGRLADRFGPRAVLGPMLVAGGGFAIAIPPVIDLVGPRVDSNPTGIVSLALSGFFLPAFALSGVPPSVAKLRLRTTDATGRVVGSVSAIGTAGAIFGTFLSGFVLISAVPTRRTVIGLGLALAFAGVAAAVVLTRRGAPALLAVVAIGAAPASAGARGPCDAESLYYCVRVTRDVANDSGRFLYLDDLLHSYVDLEDPAHLRFHYILAIASAIDARHPDAIDALHIGGGGFSLPRYLSATRRARNTVLEIDPRVVETNRDRLGLREGSEIRVRLGDGRVRLDREPRASYDVVVGDAFASLSVPWHLTTVEFVAAIRDVLRPGGLYAVNLIDFPPLRFARAEAATLLEVFPHVIAIAPPNFLAGHAGGNFVFVASMRPIDTEAIGALLRARSPTQEIGSARDFARGGRVLRDDHAPVDQLIAIPG